jgi:hypothetical protein
VHTVRGQQKSTTGACGNNALGRVS